MKIGDVVRIVRGEVLERVGYPETIQSAKQKMMDDFKTQHPEGYMAFMQQAFPFLGRGLDELSLQLAKEYNRNVLGFGGHERKIFTKYVPEYDDQFAQLTNRVQKQTGKYSGSSGYGEDYEGARLVDQKSHVFFEVSLHHGINPSSDPISYLDLSRSHIHKAILIEKKHLEFCYTPFLTPRVRASSY